MGGEPRFPHPAQAKMDSRFRGNYGRWGGSGMAGRFQALHMVPPPDSGQRDAAAATGVLPSSVQRSYQLIM